MTWPPEAAVWAAKCLVALILFFSARASELTLLKFNKKQVMKKKKGKKIKGKGMNFWSWKNKLQQIAVNVWKAIRSFDYRNSMENLKAEMVWGKYMWSEPCGWPFRGPRVLGRGQTLPVEHFTLFSHWLTRNDSQDTVNISSVCWCSLD